MSWYRQNTGGPAQTTQPVSQPLLPVLSSSMGSPLYTVVDRRTSRVFSHGSIQSTTRSSFCFHFIAVKHLYSTQMVGWGILIMYINTWESPSLTLHIHTCKQQLALDWPAIPLTYRGWAEIVVWWTTKRDQQWVNNTYWRSCSVNPSTLITRNDGL